MGRMERGTPRRFCMDPEASEVPSFIIGGTPKAGTSSLFDWLSRHPQVAPSRQKEINYFDRNFLKGWEWYTAFWPKNAPREALKFRGNARPPLLCDMPKADARFLTSPEAHFRLA